MCCTYVCVLKKEKSIKTLFALINSAKKKKRGKSRGYRDELYVLGLALRVEAATRDGGETTPTHPRSDSKIVQEGKVHIIIINVNYFQSFVGSQKKSCWKVKKIPRLSAAVIAWKKNKQRALKNSFRNIFYPTR